MTSGVLASGMTPPRDGHAACVRLGAVRNLRRYGSPVPSAPGPVPADRTP